MLKRIAFWRESILNPGLYMLYVCCWVYLNIAIPGIIDGYKFSGVLVNDWSDRERFVKYSLHTVIYSGLMECCCIRV